ncbi:hypothetical protein QE152_g38481 [Popillia japonica]|uniref:Uncharacterized protein n=1 Tax=Popillia japonica TaxID=7064 RepID=A0AAW1HWL4_POPJA
MSAKRKRTVVSLETKLQAINMLDKGETKWKNGVCKKMKKSWRKLLNITDSQETLPTTENDNDNDVSLAQLAQRLADETITENDVAEWINADEELEVTDEMIVEQ